MEQTPRRMRGALMAAARSRASCSCLRRIACADELMREKSVRAGMAPGSASHCLQGDGTLLRVGGATVYALHVCVAGRYTKFSVQLNLDQG